MNHPWQQPIRPLEYLVRSEIPTDELPEGVTWRPIWTAVLFIRPRDYGWEIVSITGTRWTDETAILREVAQ